MLAPPAHATDVASLAVGSEIRGLVAGPDGGAWVSIARRDGYAIGRAVPGGGFRTTAAGRFLHEGIIGPDGSAWFTAGDRLVRADAAGAVSFVPVADPSIGGLATGPDGNLWTATQSRERQLVRVSPQGARSVAPFPLRNCRASSPAGQLVRASDGSVWIAGGGCARLARVAPDGTATVVALDAQALAPDHSGGLWFVTFDGDIGHVDAAGRVTRSLREEGVVDIAVAPDGSPWVALARCEIARVNGSVLERHPVPVPAREIEFDAAGGVWLASYARLVHGPLDALAGECDDRAPTIRLSHQGRVTLAALRRGLVISVDEPAHVAAFVSFGSRGYDLSGTPRSGRLRLPIFPRRLARELAAGRRVTIIVSVRVIDAEQNGRDRLVRLRVVR